MIKQDLVSMKIYLAADHRGFELKEKVKVWLGKQGYRVVDLGNDHYNPNDDYPDFARKLVKRLLHDQGRGILFCGSGIGVDIVANRFPGIRCGLGLSPEQIKHGRQNDDINCLALAADFLDFAEAKGIVMAFLETEFDEKASHRRRLRKVHRIQQDMKQDQTGSS